MRAFVLTAAALLAAAATPARAQEAQGELHAICQRGTGSHQGSYGGGEYGQSSSGRGWSSSGSAATRSASTPASRASPPCA